MIGAVTSGWGYDENHACGRWGHTPAASSPPELYVFQVRKSIAPGEPSSVDVDENDDYNDLWKYLERSRLVRGGRYGDRFFLILPEKGSAIKKRLYTDANMSPNTGGTAQNGTRIKPAAAAARNSMDFELGTVSWSRKRSSR